MTGGNRGIGRAIAVGLVEAGLDVVIGVRDEESGPSAASELGVRWAALDVTHDAECWEVIDEEGPFDVLVNNAGILEEGGLYDDPYALERHLAVMVRGPHYLMHGVLPGMRERGYGRIVNLSSGWGAFAEGMAGPGPYAVAKAALNAMTVAAAREAPAGVKINATCPGWVKTRMGGPGANLSPEAGADTAIWLATLPEDGRSGGFFRRRKEIPW